MQVPSNGSDGWSVPSSKDTQGNDCVLQADRALSVASWMIFVTFMLRHGMMSTQPRGPWTPIASFPLLRNRTISPDPSHNPPCHEGDPDFLYGCPRFHIQRRWSVLQDPGPWYVDRQADPPRSNPWVPPGGRVGGPCRSSSVRDGSVNIGPILA